MLTVPIVAPKLERKREIVTQGLDHVSEGAVKKPKDRLFPD